MSSRSISPQGAPAEESSALSDRLERVLTSAVEIDSPLDPAPAHRLSDRWNPILVKEVRQALRGRYFKISFGVVLTAATLGGLAMILTMASGAGSEEALGPPFFLVMFAALALATLVLVPFSAYLSMAGELDENTFDLLILSNLRPQQIVLGKVLSAGVQVLLFYCAFGPFLVFAFLLRGIDPGALVAVTVISLVLSILLTCLSLAMSSLSRARFARVVLMVLLATVLMGTGFGTLVWAQGLMAFPESLSRGDERENLTGLLLVCFGGAGLCVAIACARLAHPEENRSTGLRLTTLGLVLCCLGNVSIVLGARAGDQLLAGVFMTHLVLSSMTLFFITEPERLGKRVAADLPRNRLLLWLAMPFLPGGARGLLFYLLVSALVVGWVFAHRALFGNSATFTPGQAFVPFAFIGYGLGFLGIPSAFFAIYPSTAASRARARSLIVLLIVAVVVGPAVIGFLAGLENWQAFRHPFNVFWVTGDLFGHGRLTSGVIFIVSLAAACGTVLNLPRILAAAAELKRAHRANLARQP